MTERPSPLPDWAEKLRPLDMFGAAAVLGISRRTLVDVLKIHKHYEQRGSKKVFYPENIESIREALKCRASKRAHAAASFMPSVPLPDSAYDKALALASKGKRKNSAPSSKRASGNVIPMAKRP